MASDTVDLIIDFNLLISSALISFNKGGTPPLQPYLIILNGASQLHDIDCLLKTRSYILFINLCEKLLQGLKCWWL
jgi:hypothetical protein